MTEKSELISGRKQVKFELISVAKLFMAACFVGAFAIILGVSFNSLILSIGLPILTMVSYIFATLKWQNDLPISVVGDSFYYLGFIFTLVALVASLVSLSANESVDMNSVVGSFGAALITTIIGLIARLVVTSFSVQVKERRERLENEIERSLASFSEHLESLTTGVVGSISKVHVESEEALRNTLSQYESVHNESLDKYKLSMESGREIVMESMTKLASRIDGIEVSPDILSKPLTSALAEITKTLSEHHQSYAEVNASMSKSNRALSGQFDKTTNVINEHVDRLESALSTSIEKQTSLYQERLSEIGDGILKSLGDITDIKLEAEDGVRSKLAGLEKEIDLLAKGIRRIAEPIETSSITIGKSTSQIAEGLNRFNEASGRIDTFMNSVKLTTATVAGLQTDLERLVLTTNELSTRFKGVTDVSVSAGEKMTAAAVATENSSTQVAKDITEVYKQLALQIKTLKEMT
jgi:hypothetical protein